MLCGYKVSVVERTGLVDLTLSSATSCSALWIFFTPFGRRKSYGPNSPIHTSLCVTSFLQRWFTGDPRPIAFFYSCYLRHVGWKRLFKYSLIICDFLFCPVDFLHSLRSWKTLRAELPDSHTFMRRFAPLKVVHWGSQAYCILP